MGARPHRQLEPGRLDRRSRAGSATAWRPGSAHAQGEVLFADSTSVNLYKVLHAALQLQQGQRTRIVSERSNFPTDNYIAQSVARAHGGELVLVDHPTSSRPCSTNAAAVLLLTHVHYRSGRMHDMALLTRWAQQAGALAVWDLAHSAGAVPVDLLGAAADFAVGCGYKYLNGGPGAPAFVWVHPRHHGQVWQPLTGWLGHAAPFRFEPDYRPAEGIQQYQCGTPPILAMAGWMRARRVRRRAEAGRHGGAACQVAGAQPGLHGLRRRAPEQAPRFTRRARPASVAARCRSRWPTRTATR
jgi:kynureninase